MLNITENTIEIRPSGKHNNKINSTLEYDTANEFIILKLSRLVVAGNRYIVEMGFDGHLSENLVGLYLSSYVRDNSTVYLATTHFEAIHARKAFPCFDEPAIKANFKITLVRKKHMISLSNTRIMYQDNSVKLLMITSDMIAIPDSKAGAMENWGLITYRETFMLFHPLESFELKKQQVTTIVSHELAHMRYLNNHLYDVATHDDLWYSLGNQSKTDRNPKFIQNIKHIMDTWVMQMNYPTVFITRDRDKLILKQSRYLLDTEAIDPGTYESPFGYVLFTVYVLIKQPRTYFGLIYIPQMIYGLFILFNLCFVLKRSGEVNTYIALQTLDYLPNEDNHIPFRAASTEIEYLRKAVVDTDLNSTFSKFMKEIFSKHFNKYGLDNAGAGHADT
ncbi:ANPEP [Mytilus coruscus]|uniref:ANPEP n=1 Tax=Mytilus coruscus TaxID=42192 RepID=A0A6J8BTP0_MYTCO|nr:ANPEP [Mytilus coruscus]